MRWPRRAGEEEGSSSSSDEDSSEPGGDSSSPDEGSAGLAALRGRRSCSSSSDEEGRRWALRFLVLGMAILADEKGFVGGCLVSVVYWEGEVFVWMGGLLFEGGCWQLRDSCVSLYVVFEVDERIFF